MGTISSSPEVRAQQAISQRTHTELQALAPLDAENCTAVPRLLGHAERLQGTDDLGPGGYINYVAWERNIAGEFVPRFVQPMSKIITHASIP
ncbi:uncharacterized protein N7515_004468 [Penicillium bovifimosum]|uniref:Uncharacterized protein n=1 Tax=Penicillium bovifimosum TaxID=126998 RepID=A0A9W9H0B2_9EURO|nr:uncharacterized protein N7515_004468 [Penicillium bovifimosum]KAJ5135190.1 hypothetical protein N7515_004468 [Penicillium bovifimosum]